MASITVLDLKRYLNSAPMVCLLMALDLTIRFLMVSQRVIVVAQSPSMVILSVC